MNEGLSDIFWNMKDVLILTNISCMKQMLEFN